MKKCKFCGKEFNERKIEGQAEHVFCSKLCRDYNNQLNWLLKKRIALKEPKTQINA